MRKLIHILCFVCFSILSAKAQIHQWNIIPLNTNVDFNEIELVQDSILVLPGNNGTLAVRTQNGLWSLLQASNNKRLVSVENIIYPNLGGLTKISSDDCDIYTLIQAANGLVLAPDSIPARPTNGRKVIKIVDLNISNVNETRYGIICDSGRIMAYKFPFASPRFDINLSTKKSIQDLYPFNSWNILAVGDSGKIWRTVGLNDPFQAINNNLSTTKLNKIIGRKDNKLWIAGDSGLVLFSGNGGLSWSKRNTPTNLNLFSGWKTDSTLWICGQSGLIMYSNDEGQSWTLDNSNTSSDLKDIKVLNNDVFTTGKNGVLLQLNLLTATSKPKKAVQYSISNQAERVTIENLSQENLNLVLMSTEGKTIRQKTVQGFSNFEIGQIPTGIYFLRLESKNEVPTFQKILIRN